MKLGANYIFIAAKNRYLCTQAVVVQYSIIACTVEQPRALWYKRMSNV